MKFCRVRTVIGHECDGIRRKKKREQKRARSLPRVLQANCLRIASRVARYPPCREIFFCLLDNIFLLVGKYYFACRKIYFCLSEISFCLSKINFLVVRNRCFGCQKSIFWSSQTKFLVVKEQRLLGKSQSIIWILRATIVKTRAIFPICFRPKSH